MDEQGCSVVDEGVVLDRLAGLQSVITSERIRQALEATGRVGQRQCLLSHEVMLWVVLAMGLLTHLPIRQVFKFARRMRMGERTPPRSSLCEARQRLGVEPVRSLHESLVRPLATPETPGGFYKNLRWMAIDSTVLDVPDSQANAAAFGRSSGGRGDAAFPQVRKCSLVELGTHVEAAIAIGGYHEGEQTLARQLFDRIPDDALLLEDRGFFSYEDWKTLDSLGKKLLVRVKDSLVLKRVQVLADGSYIARIYPSPYHRRKDRQGLEVRIIEYTLDDPQRTGHGQTHRLMTNLFDVEQFPALELVAGYHQRWEEELVYDEQKTHQDPCRAEKPTHLRSETPGGVLQELYAVSLGHFVIRALMFQAAQQAQLDPDRLSFTGCFRILQCRLPECHSGTLRDLAAWHAALLQEMRHEQIPQRQNRINPRVIKRKMSKWPKKRPTHSHPPPLAKRFEQAVVMVS